ncbi:MAG TPA: type II toxin-antitoxin system RelE/ParE family toxin [Pontimonas sp.]|nr:type II toxin-antitoxin system RelE/ParE family toxin [Pontimonas sp.]
MILSFGDKHTEEVFTQGGSRKWHPHVCRIAQQKLVLLDSVSTLGDLAALKSLRLEKLQGNLHSRWSIRVNAQWRIIFGWTSEGPEGVGLVDYHA